MWDTNAKAHQFVLRKAKGLFLFQTENQPMYVKQLGSCWSHTNKAAADAEAFAPPREPRCSAGLPLQTHSLSVLQHPGSSVLQPDLRPHQQYKKVHVSRDHCIMQASRLCLKLWS